MRSTYLRLRAHNFGSLCLYEPRPCSLQHQLVLLHGFHGRGYAEPLLEHRRRHATGKQSNEGGKAI